MRTVEVELYKFGELSPETKQKVLDDWRDKKADWLYDDLNRSIQDDEIWQEKLGDFGLSFASGGLYHDSYRGEAGFGDLDIEDYKKLADALGIDKRTKLYKVIANEDVHFELDCHRDYNDISEVAVTEYGIDQWEYEELGEKLHKDLEEIANTIEQTIKQFESDLLKAVRAGEEYIFSDEALTEMIEANEYEFTKGGELAW